MSASSSSQLANSVHDFSEGLGAKNHQIVVNHWEYLFVPKISWWDTEPFFRDAYLWVWLIFLAHKNGLHTIRYQLVGGDWNVFFIFPFSWEWNNHPN
jgi:hypothetical protein